MGTAPERHLRHRLRERLPEILIEAGSVVFAILLAFAVEGWRQDRQNAEVAARARQGILAELRANQADLGRSLAAHQFVLQRLPEMASAAEADTLTNLEVGLSMAGLTTSAWRAAQASEAASFFDYEWLLDVSRVYELQGLYVQGQHELVGRLGDLEGPSASWLRSFERRLALNQRIGENLAESYARVLEAVAEVAP